LAMFSFWFCALKGRFQRPAEVHAHARLLFPCWTLLIVVGPVAALLSALGSGHHLAGLYEWLASAAAYLFLLAAAALLPDTTGTPTRRALASAVPEARRLLCLAGLPGAEDAGELGATTSCR